MPTWSARSDRLLDDGRIPDPTRRAGRAAGRSAHRTSRCWWPRHVEAANIQAALLVGGHTRRRGAGRQRAAVAGRRADALAGRGTQSPVRPAACPDGRPVMVRRSDVPTNWPRSPTPNSSPSRSSCVVGPSCWPRTVSPTCSPGSGRSPACSSGSWARPTATATSPTSTTWSNCCTAPARPGGAVPAGLLAVLDTEPDDEGDTEMDGDVAARRIASEADAVQIMTVWAAKGLEFPVVCLPTLWRPPFKSEAVAYVDPVTGQADTGPGAGEGLARPGRRRRARRTGIRRGDGGEAPAPLRGADPRAAPDRGVVGRADRSSLTALARFLFARSGAVIDPELVRGP